MHVTIFVHLSDKKPDVCIFIENKISIFSFNSFSDTSQHLTFNLVYFAQKIEYLDSNGEFYSTENMLLAVSLPVFSSTMQIMKKIVTSVKIGLLLDNLSLKLG